MARIRRSEAVWAWHLVSSDAKETYQTEYLDDDGNWVTGHQPVEAGYIYSVTGPIRLCHWGYHASRHFSQACRYHLLGPGHYICRVRLWGDSYEGDDKLVARHKEVLWMTKWTSIKAKAYYNPGSRFFSENSNPCMAVRYLREQTPLRYRGPKGSFLL